MSSVLGGVQQQVCVGNNLDKNLSKAVGGGAPEGVEEGWAENGTGFSKSARKRNRKRSAKAVNIMDFNGNKVGVGEGDFGNVKQVGIFGSSNNGMKKTGYISPNSYASVVSGKSSNEALSSASSNNSGTECELQTFLDAKLGGEDGQAEKILQKEKTGPFGAKKREIGLQICMDKNSKVQMRNQATMTFKKGTKDKAISAKICNCGQWNQNPVEFLGDQLQKMETAQATVTTLVANLGITFFDCSPRKSFEPELVIL